MCIWFTLAMWAAVPLYAEPPDKVIFHGYSMQNILSRKLLNEGRSISFEDADYLPLEPDHQLRHDVCRSMISEFYRDFVYGLAEHHNCDVKYISGIALVNLDGQVFDPITADKLKSTTVIPTPEEHARCDLARLGGYCPTYLKYVECIYFNYIKSNTATKNLVLPTLDRLLDLSHPLLHSYFQRDTTAYSRLLDETLFQMCRFVNTACGSLHPQFENSKEFRLQHLCAVFDTYTPLEGYEELYNASLSEKELRHLVISEQRLGEQHYVNLTFDGIEFSPLGVPHDTYINSQSQIHEFFREICKRRCEYHRLMRVLTNEWNKLSASGYHRQVILCARHTTICPTCETCRNMGVLI